MKSLLFPNGGANALSQKQNKESEHHARHYEVQVHRYTSSASFAARADLAARLAAAFGMVHMHGTVEVYTAAACFIITFHFDFLLHTYHVPSYKISSISIVVKPWSRSLSIISPVKPNVFATDFKSAR